MFLFQYMEAVNDEQPEKSEDSNSEEEEEENEEDEEIAGGDESVQLPERDNVLPNQRVDNVNQGGTDSPAGQQTNTVDNRLKGKQKAEHGVLSSGYTEADGLFDPSKPDREISRSPPQSRSPSPSSLAKMTAALSLSSQQHSGIKDIVSSDLTKQRARQRQKYHSKRGAQRIGRPKGSKAKQDTRVKLDKSGVWE
jgi:RIO kinase 2